MIGSSRATVIAGPMPGSTPTTVPSTTPSSAQSRFSGVSAVAKPSSSRPRDSIRAPPAGRRRAARRPARGRTTRNTARASTTAMAASRTHRRLPERGRHAEEQQGRGDGEAERLEQQGVAEEDRAEQRERPPVRAAADVHVLGGLHLAGAAPQDVDGQPQGDADEQHADAGGEEPRTDRVRVDRHGDPRGVDHEEGAEGEEQAGEPELGPAGQRRRARLRGGGGEHRSTPGPGRRARPGCGSSRRPGTW